MRATRRPSTNADGWLTKTDKGIRGWVNHGATSLLPRAMPFLMIMWDFVNRFRTGLRGGSYGSEASGVAPRRVESGGRHGSRRGRRVADFGAVDRRRQGLQDRLCQPADRPARGVW